MNLTEAIAQALGDGMAFVLFCWIVGISFIVGLAALITWVVKKIWNAGNESKKSKSQNDWLSEAQKRQNSRYDYTDPVQRPRRQKGKQKPQNEPTWYPSGWTWNEEKQLWDPPDYIQNESNDKWKWDPEKKIWIDLEKQRRMERYQEFRAKEGKPPTYEEWKAQREREE